MDTLMRLRLEGRIAENKKISPEVLKDGVFEVLTYEKIDKTAQ